MKLLRCLPWFALLLPGLLRAQAVPMTMSTLQNLPAVAIEVRGLAPAGVQLGLTQARLVEVVRAELQKAGMRIVQSHEVERQPGAPVLEITANLSQFGAKSCLFILDLQLREQVQTVRKTPTLVTFPAVTWAEQASGYTAKPETVYAKLAGLAERFANEWVNAGVAGR